MNLHRVRKYFLSASALKRRLRLLRVGPALAVMAVLAAGCAGNEEFDLATNIKDAYTDAQQAVDVGNYRKAIAIFEGLQATKRIPIPTNKICPAENLLFNICSPCGNSGYKQPKFAGSGDCFGTILDI
jgi:hypothetical protein